MSANHTLLGKAFHWAFVLLYAYGIFKQIDDLDQLEDDALLRFEIVFASVFLLLVVVRYGYMRRFETFQGSTVPVHRYHKRFARLMHVAMYLCLVLLPLTGLAIAALFSRGMESGLRHGGSHWLARPLRRPEACPHRRSRGGGASWPLPQRRGRLDVDGARVHRKRAEHQRVRVKAAALEHRTLERLEALVASKKR